MAFLLIVVSAEMFLLSSTAFFFMVNLVFLFILKWLIKKKKIHADFIHVLVLFFKKKEKKI